MRSRKDEINELQARIDVRKQQIESAEAALVQLRQQQDRDHELLRQLWSEKTRRAKKGSQS